MSELDTPRTDKEMNRIEDAAHIYPERYDCWCAMINFARELERENNRLKRQLEELCSAVTARMSAGKSNAKIIMNLFEAHRSALATLDRIKQLSEG